MKIFPHRYAQDLDEDLNDIAQEMMSVQENQYLYGSISDNKDPYVKKIKKMDKDLGWGLEMMVDPEGGFTYRILRSKTQGMPIDHSYKNNACREIDLGQCSPWSFIRAPEAHDLGWAMGGPWKMVNL